MANAKQSAKRRLTMAERAQQLMLVHFPAIPEAFKWTRKTHDGFSTIPRTLPIAMQIIDADSKGQPAGHVLFCLWARMPDHPVITIENPSTFAAEAGFLGERAVDTWRRRMKKLRELNFIMTKPGASGEFHYVMLTNPNAAVEWMRNHGKVQDGLYSRFIERLPEIGAYGDIEALHAYWKMLKDAEEAAAAEAAKQASTTSAPPPPPPVPPTKPKRIRRTKANA
ncbi:hypothetical protein ACTMQT_28355 [Pseudomonas syringae pv. aptata]|uniref:hypothetical protein n=1 Tax=Pseudomonas syringae TaxID=317 RepID=UPI00196835E4|nr:hypothetical protein [Pseudomonas syringae]